jgi:hypothetical protein
VSRRSALLLFSALLTVRADPPAAVLDLFREIAEALTDKDPGAFLRRFDQRMPGYETLRGHVEELTAGDEVLASSIDIASDTGDDRRREIELDWLLKIGKEEPRRAILRVTVERQGRTWKITALDPADFFRRS